MLSEFFVKTAAAAAVAIFEYFAPEQQHLATKGSCITERSSSSRISIAGASDRIENYIWTAARVVVVLVSPADMRES